MSSRSRAQPAKSASLRNARTFSPRSIFARFNASRITSIVLSYVARSTG